MWDPYACSNDTIVTIDIIINIINIIKHKWHVSFEDE